MPAAIALEHVGKAYRIARGRARSAYRYVALRDVIAERARALLRPRSPDGREEFWALRDLSLTIAHGEAVGIVGRNGAGKSTLLKLLSRITDPSAGVIRIAGRVASLLEVGTGFHPELTGRENIYLNGAILGMSRAEVRSRFDEIVAFAEIERFLETPVKHYSSGMYTRLAFAVAAHLQPEILLVDEVLAVGDAAFQKKCLGKMDAVARGGRTVLFVSHHMPSVARLCRRCLLFDQGRLVMDGPAAEVTGRYLQTDSGMSTCRRFTVDTAPGDEAARLLQVRVRSPGLLGSSLDIRAPVEIEMDFLNLREGARLLCCFSLFNDQGQHLLTCADFAEETGGHAPRRAGVHRARCTVPGNLFAEGVVRVAAEVSTREPVYQIHFLEHDAVAFQVIDTGEPGSVRAGWGRPLYGLLRPAIPFNNEYLGPQHNPIAEDT
jgi:lipopolysaccharide transport system ATP-binding protein